MTNRPRTINSISVLSSSRAATSLVPSNPLRRSAELSHVRNWRSFADLAKSCDKAGQPADAVSAAQHAIDLAHNAKDETASSALREALAEYQRHTANTPQ